MNQVAEDFLGMLFPIERIVQSLAYEISKISGGGVRMFQRYMWMSSGEESALRLGIHPVSPFGILT